MISGYHSATLLITGLYDFTFTRNMIKGVQPTNNSYFNSRNIFTTYSFELLINLEKSKIKKQNVHFLHYMN